MMNVELNVVEVVIWVVDNVATFAAMSVFVGFWWHFVDKLFVVTYSLQRQGKAVSGKLIKRLDC